MTFEEVKKIIVDRAIEKGASCDELARAKNAKTKKAFFDFVADNITWCASRAILDAEIMDFFGEDKWANAGIFYKGRYIIYAQNKTIVLILNCSATVKTWDSSSAIVKTGDSSSSLEYQLSGSMSSIKDLDNGELLLGSRLNIIQPKPNNTPDNSQPHAGKPE